MREAIKKRLNIVAPGLNDSSESLMKIPPKEAAIAPKMRVLRAE
jgi:hypothetical protein